MRRNLAIIAWVLLSLAVFCGFLQVDYNKEFELHRQCQFGNERIEQIKVGIVESNEALIEAASRNPAESAQTPEEREATIEAFRQGVKARLDKRLPPRDCNDVAPTWYPWDGG